MVTFGFIRGLFRLSGVGVNFRYDVQHNNGENEAQAHHEHSDGRHRKAGRVICIKARLVSPAVAQACTTTTSTSPSPHRACKRADLCVSH